VSRRIDSKASVVYGRLWQYVIPHKLIGLIAIVGMAASAIIEAGLVYLLEPLMDEALVARNLETARWLPLSFGVIFFASVPCAAMFSESS
jgi:subfamily B ATP-binding cassette protein MsbA